MTNKFTKKIAVQKKVKDVDLKDLLNGADQIDSHEMCGQNHVHLRYDSVPVVDILPDPSQPRKSFDQSSLDELRVSIETKGQLQPILVRESSTNGKYVIISGERRWRAIFESEILDEALIYIKKGSNSDLDLLLMQIDENEKREDVAVIEQVQAIKRVVELCKEEGLTRLDAANRLGISKSKLSKYLTISEAPGIVTKLSAHDEIQDVEVLYNLSKAAKTNESEVAEFINRWREGGVDVNLRKASKDIITEKELASEIKPRARAKKENANGAKSKDISNLVELKLEKTGKETCKLIVISNGKPVQYFVNQSKLLQLVEAIEDLV